MVSLPCQVLTVYFKYNTLNSLRTLKICVDYFSSMLLSIGVMLSLIFFLTVVAHLVDGWMDSEIT